jgi:hypothetical protein
VPGDDNRTAGISDAGGFVPIPAFEVAINQPAGEDIPRVQDIIDLDSKTRDIAGLFEVVG